MNTTLSWLLDVSAGAVSHILSAAVIGLVLVVVWPSRNSIVASLRRWRRVVDVEVYLSIDRNYWNIEVPFRYVNDVKWRLRDNSLKPTNEISSMVADEFSDAFRLRISAYDQSFSDDVHDMQSLFERLRVSATFPAAADLHRPVADPASQKDRFEN